MVTNPQPDLSQEWVSDKVDLDELFSDVKPIGDGEDWALPGFFASDEEAAQFQAWLKTERSASV